MADGDMPRKKPLDRDVNRIGDSFIFPPRVMDDIHIKSELGRIVAMDKRHATRMSPYRASCLPSPISLRSG